MATEVSPVRIFLAEDNPADVFLFREALRSNGITCSLTRYSDGEATLDALGRIGPGDLPHLFIIDLNLPRISGMEILKHIRTIPVFEGIPIAIFTSSQSAADRVEAQRLGANAFITKPPTLPEFVDAVGSAVRALIGVPGAVALLTWVLLPQRRPARLRAVRVGRTRLARSTDGVSQHFPRCTQSACALS